MNTIMSPLRARARRSEARMPALDGIRGVAILLVVAAHTNIAPELFLGPTGVTVFFVLSGFLITGTLLRERARTGRVSLRRFYFARMVRLMPALLVMQAVVGALWVIGGRQLANYFQWAVPTTLYLANFFLRIDVPNVFIHTWSLAVEEQFYLLWPLVLGAIALWRRSHAIALLGLVAAASVSLRIAMVDHVITAYSSLPTNSFALLLGAIVAITRTRWAAHPALRRRLLIVCPLLIAALVWKYGESWPKNVTGPPLVAVPAAAWIAAAAQGSKTLQLAPLRYIGRISYPWYLWHWPLIFLVDPAAHPNRAVPAALVAALMAVGSTHLLEEPLRRAWHQRNAPAATSAAPAIDAGSQHAREPA